MNYKSILDKQRLFFETDKTKDVHFRVAQLKKLKTVLKHSEQRLYDAIYKDFKKSEFETYVTELSQIYHELNVLLKKINTWSKKKRVSTNLINLPGRSYIIPEPLGCVLVIGAWNYPYYLSLVPVVSALGAGNTVILKPSEMPSNTAKVMSEIINSNFDTEVLTVVEGGVPETTELLKNRFDKIFFTGSTSIGKIIYKAAAENLTPVTLELGGKSPAFILSDCDIQTSVKRIVWSKYLNAGQTCVAPDYLLIDQAIENLFLEALKKEIDLRHNHTEDIQENYVQIIDYKNYERLEALLDTKKLAYGGVTDRSKRYIGPTVLKDVSFEDEIMRSEIFGPILPIISFNDLDSAIQQVKNHDKPLSLYIYSKNTKSIKHILSSISFGGGMINDGVAHLSNSSLPFGGVGTSGIGNYHGKAGFDTFSHQKSIIHKNFWIEPSIKYLPFSKWKQKVLKLLIE